MADSPLKDRTPDTANERYFDAALRHQVGVRRFTAGEVRRLREMLQLADRDFIRLIRSELSDLVGKRVNVRSDRFRNLIDLISEKRRETVVGFRRKVKEMLTELVKTEVEFEVRMLKEALPVEIPIKEAGTVAAAAVIGTTIIPVSPDRGRTLQQWFSEYQRTDLGRAVEAIQLGYAQGQSVNTIARRLAGTKANGFADGILSVSRRNAEAIVRTSINSISNQAREQVFRENSDIIHIIRWTSVLDGRTSAVCRGRDGRYTPNGSYHKVPRKLPKLDPPEVRPPAHVNCRSQMVGIIDGMSIADQMGDRPFVRDARTRRFRERDFRREAKAKGISVQEVRQQWADENIGTVPGDTNYNDWLMRQPEQFQNEVLGKRKAELFRTGQITLDQFTDRAGNELTLDQLKKTRPEVFEEAGV